MGKASFRVRRGFNRLGLVVLVPAILAAIGILLYQSILPTGEYHTREVDSKVWNDAPVLTFREWSETDLGSKGDYTLQSQYRDALVRQGNSFELLDGRRVRAWSGRSDELIQASQMAINRTIVAVETSMARPLGSADGPFQIGKTWVDCDGYAACEIPAFGGKARHLSRAPEFVIALIPLAIGGIWFGLMWAVSWLIRGFLSD